MGAFALAFFNHPIRFILKGPEREVSTKKDSHLLIELHSISIYCGGNCSTVRHPGEISK